MRKCAIMLAAVCLLSLLPAGCNLPAEDASPTPAGSAEPTPSPEQGVLPYVFGSPLEESGPVEDDSFFDDAVFLGDSRTHGLQLYSGLTHGDFYVADGMSVFGVDGRSITFEVDGENVTMVGTLSKKQYGKVYVMLGVNELGSSVSSYEEALASFVDKIIAAQPNAVVYLQFQPPVNDEVARQHLAAAINNENINAFNEAIKRVAADKKVALLDVGSAYRDENGQLPAEMTWDGCHFNFGSDTYGIWVDYLRTHTIDPARYFCNRELAKLAAFRLVGPGEKTTSSSGGGATVLANVPDGAAPEGAAEDYTAGSATVESSPADSYRFGTALAATERVDDDTFSNAVFIGDSRTEGFQYWGGIKSGTFYWKRGMSVFSVNSSKFTFNVDGQKVTLVGALDKRQYDKVYIMLGINELGYSAERYEQGLGSLVDEVLDKQPNAVIYLQTLAPVNDALAREHLGAVFNNAKVNAFNEAIVRVAESKRVVLLDTGSIYRDGDGQLPYNMSSDGCHFASSGYAGWGEYLRTHVMSAEYYFACRGGEEGTPEPPPEPTPVETPEPAPEQPPTGNGQSAGESAQPTGEGTDAEEETNG